MSDYCACWTDRSGLSVSFVNTETVVGDRALSDIGAWDWAPRLAGVGVERIEIDPGVTSDEYGRFVDDIWRKINGRPESSAEARQMVASSIRFGPLLVREGGGSGPDTNGAGPAMLEGFASSLSLQDEAATVDWIHDEVSMSERLPMGEVEAVVRSLSVAMQMEHRMLLPLLDLKRFDQYTTTHACNVSVLAMGLAERLGLGREEVRSFGVAGLLHDLGKIRIPKEILTKPGKLSDEERIVIQSHPVEGARIVLSRERGLGVAAVVAYEHHVCIDGGGYPTFRFTRTCHYASRIVHVCDIYDALCTNRPYRDAWDPEKALSYLESRAGSGGGCRDYAGVLHDGAGEHSGTAANARGDCYGLKRSTSGAGVQACPGSNRDQRSAETFRNRTYPSLSLVYDESACPFVITENT